MGWFSIAIASAAVLSCVTAGIVVAVMLVRGGWGPSRTVQVSWLLAVAAAVVGGVLAVMVTPDWNPFSMVLVFAPFWSLTVWSAAFARDFSRGVPARRAAVRACWLAVPSIVLAPLGGVLLGVAGVPLTVIAFLVARGQCKRVEGAVFDAAV